MHGYSDNYIKVKLPFDAQLANILCDMKLNAIDADGLVKATPVEVHA
jgi:hypothetical protein